MPKTRADAETRLRVALERAAAQWRTTFDAIAAPILILDFDARVARLNRAARELTGKSYQEILGRRATEVDGGRLWQEAAELVAAVRQAHGSISRQVRDPARGVTWDVTAHYRGTDAEVEDEQVIVVARDISRLVELQESLRRSEMMSALGSLVAGVAHQVRNPLFGMSAALDAFEARVGDQPAYHKYVVALREPLARLNELMKDLLAYGRPAVAARAPATLAQVLTLAIRSCQPLAERQSVEVRLAADPELPPVAIDAGRVQQVFENLIENAIQHSPVGGEVAVEARLEPAAGGPCVLCGVQDQGAGFLPQDLPRVFEPFFTRRPGGTGLGLSLVERIVEENGGRVRAGNQPAGGARVEVRFPAIGAT